MRTRSAERTKQTPDDRRRRLVDPKRGGRSTPLTRKQLQRLSDRRLRDIAWITPINKRLWLDAVSILKERGVR